MDYTKYYTPHEIASLLVSQLDIEAPKEAIDICCGSCNLLQAASDRWPETELIGVDVVKHLTEKIKCITGDGRKYSIEHPHQYSLVLANPPFDRAEAEQQFPELYSEFPDGLNTSRLEIEMLYANLKLLSTNGTLMIIMPSTFINSVRNKKYRVFLSNRYRVAKIITLPSDSFGSAMISCCAIEIHNCAPTGLPATVYTVSSTDAGYIVTDKSEISYEQVILGNWANQSDCIKAYAKSLPFECRRGNMSSSSFAAQGLPLLHTSKQQDDWKPSLRYTKEYSKLPVYAEAGDILVSRIGKSAGQWCVYDGDRAVISDCLYRIKDPDGSIGRKLSGKQYPYASKGVATRYITIADFASWYQSL